MSLEPSVQPEPTPAILWLNQQRLQSVNRSACNAACCAARLSRRRLIAAGAKVRRVIRPFPRKFWDAARR